jgi:putative transposase
VIQRPKEDPKARDKVREARRRWQIIQPLAVKKRTSLSEVKAAADKIGISVAQTYKLISAGRAQSVAKVLEARKPGFPKGESRLHPRVDTLIEEHIRKDYLTREQPSIQVLYEIIWKECREQGLPVPSKKAVSSRVHRVSPKKQTRARRGFKEVRERHVMANAGLRASAPLDIVEIDHHKADVLIVGDAGRQLIGRAYLTVVLDVFSRCIVGFSLSLKANAANSLAAALVQAFSPKEPWCKRHKIKMDWPVFGIPKRIHVDLGADFISEAFRDGCEKYGIQLTYRERGKPHQSGLVERMFGTLSKRIKRLPGTTFSNPMERGSYNSEKRAALTLEELRTYLAHEIDLYHHREHKSLHTTPLYKWKQGIEQNGPPVFPDEDFEAIIIDFFPFKWRKIRREGIEIFGEKYFHKSLTDYLEQELSIKYDPEDIGTIFVELPGPESCYLPIERPDLKHLSISDNKARRMERRRPPSELDDAIKQRAISAREQVIRSSKVATRQERRGIGNTRIGRKSNDV